MCAISWAATSIALTPSVGYAECALAPRTLTRMPRLPLWATTISIFVGSPMMAIDGTTGIFSIRSSSRRTPIQPTSSSYDNAIWIGVVRLAATISGTHSNTQAMNPFISALPRPKTLSSIGSRTNGSLAQRCPSTGTTSVCPDNMTPPSSAGPIVA